MFATGGRARVERGRADPVAFVIKLAGFDSGGLATVIDNHQTIGGAVLPGEVWTAAANGDLRITLTEAVTSATCHLAFRGATVRRAFLLGNDLFTISRQIFANLRA